MQRNALAMATAIAIVSAGAASGQTYCGKGTQNAIQLMGTGIFGDWSMAPLGGYFVQAGEVLPFPPMDPMTWSIVEADAGRALIISPEFTDSVELRTDLGQEAELVPADYPEGLDRPISEEELGVAAGCDAAELPRLIAVSQFKTEDSNIDSTVRLIVVGPDLMYGSIEATGSVVGDTIYAFRAITLSR